MHANDQPSGKSTISAQADWTNAPERGNLRFLRWMTWLSLRLGRRISRLILHPVTFYFLLFSPVTRHASRHYLQRVLDRAVNWKDCYRHIHSFASTIHDRLYLLKDLHGLFDIRIHNEALIVDSLQQHRGVFILGAHLGSFEVIRTIGKQQDNIHPAMVMYQENAAKINALLGAINPAAQQEIIALGHIDTMLQVYEALNAGKVLCMLADRTLTNEKTLSIPLFGKNIDIPAGPFRMAMIMKRPVHFMTGLYLGGNRYDIHFDTLADFSEINANQREQALRNAAIRYGQLLEHYCRIAPYNWFNFYDYWRDN